MGGDSDDDEDGVTQVEDDAALEKRLTEEAKTVLRRWLKLEIHWVLEFPDLELKMPIDLMQLLEADVGIIYERIEKEDPQRQRYGYIPRMAHGLIGALNSEGFCERMLWEARHVMTDGETLLADDEMEKLTLLRMNKEFMKFMCANYNHLTKQQLKRTTVPL